MDEEPEYDPKEMLEKLDRFLDGQEQTTLYFELEKRGEAPKLDYESLSDEELAQALTNLVWGIWDLGVIVEDTDHLSDRELYTEILEYCDEPTVVFPDDPDTWCHWSPIGSGSDEDMLVYLRYYAGEEVRENFKEDYPPPLMPPKELPPFYRSWLPQRRPGF